jgi:DNA topoisomerase-2
MHLFHPTKGIHKYESPELILMDFIKLRHEYYIKRREHLISVLEKRTKIHDSRAKFVTMVIDGTLTVFRRKKKDLETELSELFPTADGSYDYLLNTKTIEYTEERVLALLEESKQLKWELNLTRATSPLNMWETDIKNL